MPKVGRAGKGKHTQSVLFRKRFWSKEESRKWLTKKDYYTDGYDQSGDFHRWRQYDPDAAKFRYRNDVIQESDGESSIVLVLGFPKTSSEEFDMPVVNDQLLQAIRARGQKQSEFGYGILTADAYIRTMLDCVGLDVCNQLVVTGQTSFDDMLQKAAKTLVFSNDEMAIEEKRAKLPKSLRAPKNTLMVFRHVLTTSQKDRDGDILHSDGAMLDPKMLLIYQHVPTLPIGKYLGIAKRNTKQVVVYSAIVDINELSHDSAVMVDNDMGRFSHGFAARKFTEIKAGSEGEIPSGFDITEFEVMEISLVSVPSNVGAETEEVLLSLVEGGKLTSPLMKERGRSIREHRNVTVPGIRIVEKMGDLSREISCTSFADLKAAQDAGLLGETENENKSRSGSGEGEEGTETSTPKETNDDQKGSKKEEEASDEEVECECAKCGHKQKTKGVCGDSECPECGESMKQMEREKLYVYGSLPNTWEWVGCKLRDKLRKYLLTNGIRVGERAWTGIVATYDDSVIAVVEQNEVGEELYYKMGWKMEKKEPEFSGKPKEVELETRTEIREASKTAKLLWEEKAGRSLSKANEGRLRDAAESIDEALGMEGLPKSVKALLREIAGSLKAVLGSLGEEDDKGSIEDAMTKVIAEATSEQRDKMIKTLQSMRDVSNRKKRVQDFESFLKV